MCICLFGQEANVTECTYYHMNTGYLEVRAEWGMMISFVFTHFCIDCLTCVNKHHLFCSKKINEKFKKYIEVIETK